MSILNVSGVQKIYTTRFGGNKVEALKSVSFSVEQGEYVAIMGESGFGKTTLLNILAALDKPTSGPVVLDGKALTKIKESQMTAFRRDNLGFVFQEFNLLDTFSLEDNIYLPLVLVTLRSLKKNKTGTIVTIIGIILSVVMICAVTIFASSFMNYAKETLILSAARFSVCGSSL